MAQASSYTGKTTPVSGDKVLVIDSAASNAIKTSTLAQVLNNTIIDTTWTPALTFGGAASGMTYLAQNGRYLKIGNLIYVTGYIVLTAKGSSTGTAKISLPNSAAAETQGYLNVFWSGMGASYVHVGILTDFSASTATVYGATTAATAPTALTEAAFGNSSQLRFSGVYSAG